MIIAAHRFSTVRNADQLVYLSQGLASRIMELLRCAKKTKNLQEPRSPGPAARSIVTMG